MMTSARVPELSVILPTDTFATIQPVVEKLGAQTIADRIEVILITPSIAPMKQAMANETRFAAVRILETPSLSPLAKPRALGIRAAAAPLIFVGETHSYLDPDAAEKLIAAISAGPWATVTPGFENANPRGVLSWASFLGAYGRWNASMPAGEIPEAPLYDSLYRRDVLLALGERLESLLLHGDDLRRELQALGHRVYFEPTARIKHLNIAQLGAWLHEHFLIGLTIGSRRAGQWSWAKRLAYIAAAWVIPFVLFWRVWPGVRRAAQAHPLPFGTYPAIFFLSVVKVAGEVVGYAGGREKADQARAMNHYEVRRVDYVG
jgi:hypothetical protein